jgi:trimethylamine--corrinoid protein Co-methyltransferase
MNLKGLSGGQYKPLTEEQIEKIHKASLTILEKTGFSFESGVEDTLDILEKAGAIVNREKSRIYFPRHLVTDQAAKAPEQIVLYSRDGKNDLDLTEHKVHLGTGGAAIKILDLETRKARPTTLNDLYQLGRLVDKLDNIHFFLRPCIPTDIPPEDYDVNVFYACMKSTAKHFMAGVNNLDGLHTVIDLAAIIAGSREELQKKPFLSIITSFAISPLKLDSQTVLIMQEAVRNKIPVALSCAPMAGSTSPITMAGTLAQVHAEQLAGIAICQLTNPGAPVLYGGIPGMANLRNMGYMGGAVECGMMNAAIHQMAHYIKVPNYNSAGLSDSKIPDSQAAWEKAFTNLLAAMGGSNYIHHAAGMLESMISIAYEQYVIDDEIIGMTCKVLKGIDVDTEHLALEVIDSVGPGGNYMMEEHTLEHMHNEYYEGNDVSDKLSRQKWEENGSLNTRERAKQIVKKILREDEKSYLPDDIDEKIRQEYKIFL